jgi:hypothetical protein
MEHSFCAYILTHGRPDNVKTYRYLKKHGYTGPIRLIVDDEDDTLPEYRDNFPDEEIKVFSKDDIAPEVDEGDNSGDRRAVLYARHANPKIAEEEGFEYFIQLDDDYDSFRYRLDKRLDPKFGGGGTGQTVQDLDAVFDEMARFVKETPFKTITMAQGGDLFRGGKPSMRRKAMNSFVCETANPIDFLGKLNDDVNTYTKKGHEGELYGSTHQLKLGQAGTQQQEGGLTDIYEGFGTYAKSFMTVMYVPSCTQIDTIEGNRGNIARRVHHSINYHRAFPKILREQHCKADEPATPVCREDRDEPSSDE